MMRIHSSCSQKLNSLSTMTTNLMQLMTIPAGMLISDFIHFCFLILNMMIVVLETSKHCNELIVLN